MSVRILTGDSLELLPTLAEASVDACVTDPPYHLTSGNVAVDWGALGRGATNRDGRGHKTGFMGKAWDGGDIAFRPEVWREVFRVLKPGGHLVAFGGSRTYHRLACAIEDAGFEIRDCITWHFGSGFPKSHNIGKKLDESASRCTCNSMRNVCEVSASPAVSSETDREDLLQLLVPEQDLCGAAAPSCGKRERQAAERQEIRRSQSGMEGRRDVSKAARQLREREIHSLPAGISGDGANGRLRDGASLGDGEVDRSAIDSDRVCSPQGSQAASQRARQSRTLAGQPDAQTGGAWPVCRRCGKPIVPDGLGTALKPATEFIALARKPLIGTVAANVLAHGTGALNVDGCRVEAIPGDYSSGGKNDLNGTGWGHNDSARTEQHPAGRWPANVIHDGSQEVVGAFPETSSGTFNGDRSSGKFGGIYGDFSGAEGGRAYDGSSGSAFYTAKADKDDRLSSKHPTVKPIDLMAYLCRLVCPPGGTVLDPFAGSGSTGMACMREGFDAILIEREAEYVADIKRRIAHVSGEDMPLFVAAE